MRANPVLLATLIVLGTNGFAHAAAGSDSATEYKGFSRLVIDLERGTVSGAIAAKQGERESRTVTWGFAASMPAG